MMAITGARHVGKTSRAEAYWHELVKRGIPCAGFIEKAVFEAVGSRVGYDYLSLHTGEICPFARISGRISELMVVGGGCGKEIRPHGYVYADEVWGWMRCQCDEAHEGMCWFWDEFGILEACGEGLWSNFEFVHRHLKPRAHICVCRQDTFNMIAEHLGGFDKCVFVESGLLDSK